MTDKKKLDEAASLNVTTEENGVTANTTFTAEDLAGLAALLKNAGIAGSSTAFNGPATLTVDQNSPTGGVTSSICAPDLRSIMQMIEPEFQAIGDQEAAMAAAAELPAEMDDDHIVDPAPVEDPVANVEPVNVDLGGDLTIDDLDDNMEAPVDLEVEEDADYDYRTHDVHPEEYEGTADRKPVQSDTKTVPARSGDNPLDEGSFDPNKKFPDTESGAIEAMKYLSGHNMDGATAQPDPYTAGVWMVTHNTGRSIVYLNQGDFEDIDEAAKSKGFKDYFQEASTRNHFVPTPKAREITAESLMADFRALNEAMDIETAKKLAKQESSAGHVQHVNQTGKGLYTVSDFSNHQTVASYENGRPIGMTVEGDEDLAAKKKRLHAQLRDFHKENGRDDLVDKHDEILNKNKK